MFIAVRREPSDGEMISYKYKKCTLPLRIPDRYDHTNIENLTHLSLSMEMKCLPSNPANAEIDMERLTHPFLTSASAPRRTAGWLRNRRVDESIFAKAAS